MKRTLGTLTICSLLLGACTHNAATNITPTTTGTSATGSTTTGSTGTGTTTGTTSGTTVAPSAGNWVVSYFNDKGKIETAHYTGYTFTFAASGALQAVRGGQTFSGTWKLFTDDGMQKMRISITGDINLAELSEDWVVKSSTATEMKLADDNSSHIEELTFTKQ